jgi:hypothetical protein
VHVVGVYFVLCNVKKKDFLKFKGGNVDFFPLVRLWPAQRVVLRILAQKIFTTSHSWPNRPTLGQHLGVA